MKHEGFYTKTKKGNVAHVLADKNMSADTAQAIEKMIDLAANIKVSVRKQIGYNDKILKELDCQEGCCVYCGRRMNNIPLHPFSETVDHVIAKKGRRGTDHPNNRLPCCRTCNLLKANKSLEFFLEQIEAYHAANVGGSHSTKKRWAHMVKNLKKIIELIGNFKKDIFK